MSDSYTLENGESWIGKKAISIRIITISKDIIVGKIYVADGERLQDVMNDGRDFLPIYAQEGVSWVHEVIHKKEIYRIRTLDDK